MGVYLHACACVCGFTVMRMDTEWGRHSVLLAVQSSESGTVLGTF